MTERLYCKKINPMETESLFYFNTDAVNNIYFIYYVTWTKRKKQEDYKQIDKKIVK